MKSNNAYNILVVYRNLRPYCMYVCVRVHLIDVFPFFLPKFGKYLESKMQNNFHEKYL